MKAILIIDVQKGFIKPSIAGLPAKIRRHIKAGRYGIVLFTKFVNRPASNFVKLLKWKKLYCAPETDIVPELADLASRDNTFIKSTYSAFKSRRLLAFLKRKGIKKLDVCGIESDGCVLASAFEGFDLGFEINVLRNLVASTTSLNRATENIIKRNIDRHIKS